MVPGRGSGTTRSAARKSGASRTLGPPRPSYRPRTAAPRSARTRGGRTSDDRNGAALPRRASPADPRAVPDGRRDRDDADLPRGARPPVLRRVRPARARRGRGGAPALLRAVRPDGPRPRSRDRARDGNVARQRRLGGAARAHARAAGRAQSCRRLAARRAARGARVRQDADRDLRLRRPAGRRLRRRRRDERGGGCGVPLAADPHALRRWRRPRHRAHHDVRGRGGRHRAGGVEARRSRS